MKIFLDDYRNPLDCLSYMYTRIGELNPIYNDGEWFIVRNYPDFVKAIERFAGEITHVSFDHDLCDGHYHQNMQEGIINYNSDDFKNPLHKTGYHAALFMRGLYLDNMLPLPTVFVHSLNPVGSENITELLKLR
jgi:hypothetical protein